jgi:hypothetical protein
MKPAFIYVVFCEYFVSDFICDTKKEAVTRVKKLNSRKQLFEDQYPRVTKTRPWRFQRMEGLARTVTLERG